MSNEKAGVAVGDRAPEFIAVDDSGARFSLSEQGGAWIVLFFYPKDDTPG